MSRARQSQPSPTFAPLERARSSQRVAQAIIRVIVEGQVRPGETLPPERTLAERFRVTRNTVREALRALESMRLVTVRQGSGIEVRDYLTSAGLELVVALVESSEVDAAAWILDVAEARAVIGRAMISHSLRTMPAEAFPGVVEAVNEFEAEANRPEPDVAELQRLDFTIHSRIVLASGNRALILLHNSIRHIYERVAPIFAPLFDDPRPMVLFYRSVVVALEADDRVGAVEAFDRYFELGRQAILALSSQPDEK